jgi:hypothetical protein
MTGSAQYQTQWAVACCICSEPVPLETCLTDACGKAVHEECYVRKTISRRRAVNATHLSEDWISSRVVRFQFRPRVNR